MIRSRIPLWLFWTLSIIGVLALIASYGVLSQRMTAKNPQQTIVPGVEGLKEGVVRLFKPGGTASNPRPAMIWNDLTATYWRLLLGLALVLFFRLSLALPWALIIGSRLL